MFGLFKNKKRLTDAMAGNIAIELGLMQSWTLQYRKCDLTSDELTMFIEGILMREGIERGEDEVFAIRLMALANTNFDELDELRKRVNFDQKVESFCKGAFMPEQFWTPAGKEVACESKSIRCATPFMDQVFKEEAAFERMITAGLSPDEAKKVLAERKR